MPTVDYKRAPIHYDVIDRRLPWLRGDGDGGDAIVFHHGLGARADTWCGWERALADRHVLVRLDMRGHGRSPVPDGYPWTLDALVEDLAAVADHAELARFHLVGESIGGTVALDFAARHPERVITLTVSNGAHRGSGIRNLSKWARIIDEGGMAGWSAHMMHERFHSGAIDDEAWTWYEAQQAEVDRHTVLAAAAALVAADLTGELSHVTMPVLLLHPDGSPFIPVAVMADLNAALPDSRLRVFAHAKHGLPFSHGPACAEELAALLRGASG